MRAAGFLSLAMLGLAACSGPAGDPSDWSDEQLRVLASLSLDSLPELPPDPSNAVADDPRAASLGQQLFFDERLSGNGLVSCATCHQPARFFTDGLPLSQAIGTTDRHAPSLVGVAHGEWFFWDGRADSQWAQALGPIEHPAEHGATRTLVAQVIARQHRSSYESLFGSLPPLEESTRFPASAGPLGNEEEQAAWERMSESDRAAVDRVFSNAGKAIAAYERLIRPGRAPFDEFVSATLAGETARARDLLGEEALEGLRFFLGDGDCIQCHSGPLFSNREFHAIGVPEPSGRPFDRGRADGALAALGSTFSCLGPYSDAEEADCLEMRFLKTEGAELLGAMKVPTLRNVADTAPYMHAGQMATLRDVFQHYSDAPIPTIGHTDLLPLTLTDKRMEQLEAFLRRLSAPLDMPPELLEAPSDS